MSRAVVNVATGRYAAGQRRLFAALKKGGEYLWFDKKLPPNCPSHDDKPYAFKAYALRNAAYVYGDSTTTLLWCDASIVPICPLAPLWERIERDGYWFAKSGWNNYQWTADSAYPDLFAYELTRYRTVEEMRERNKSIPHVVATAFGISTAHPTGKAFLDEYYRLASETRAFCGPWTNGPAYYDNPRQAPCGPPDVLGHRHDQTAASVIAWRLGMKLDESGIFAYRGSETEHTILVADGKY
jgi:hypothetical protein